MKKSLFLALVLVLVLVAPVLGDGITYNTGFMVQNLGSTDASITITYYNQDGTVAATVNDTIPVDGSKNYYPLTAVPDGFNGSVVISSNQPVAAVANELGNGTAYGASYAGFDAGATTMYLPTIMRNNGGFNTWFNVQNAGTADAHVTVTYTPSTYGNAWTQTATIKPGAAHTFDQATATALGSRFVGSAKVTSDQPIVATVNEVGPTTLLSYDGFGSGSTVVSFPLVNANNAGYVTGIMIMNIGTVDTTVRVSYTPGIAGTAQWEEHVVPAGGSASFAFQHFADSGERFVGSGLVTVNSANQPLVAVVNQLNTSANKGAAYGGLDPNDATDKISCPIIMAKNSGYFTGTNIMNVGTTATTVTIAYSDYGSYTGMTSGPVTLNPGETWSLNQDGVFASKYVGSVTATASSGGKIMAIVNELNMSAGGDAFLVYEGFNY